MRTIYMLYLACGVMVLMGILTSQENLIAGGIIWAILIAVVNIFVKFYKKRRK